MWGKKSKIETQEATLVALPEETYSKPVAPQPRLAASLIANGANVMGSIITSGDLSVEGKVDGDVRSALLTIGSNGLINGNVTAETATIRGKVMGNVTARTILLAGTGSIEGDLTHSVLIIEEGGVFEGRSKRLADPLAQENAAITDETSKNVSEENASNGSQFDEKQGSNDEPKSSISKELEQAFAVTA